VLLLVLVLVCAFWRLAREDVGCGGLGSVPPGRISGV
jgi:hypothetical protein